MKIRHDREVDALYIKLDDQRPDGVVELAEGVNLDTTSEGKIVGIEILDASKRLNLRTILTYELELDKKLALKPAPPRRTVKHAHSGKETLPAELKRSLRRGLRDAKAGRGRFV